MRSIRAVYSDSLNKSNSDTHIYTFSDLLFNEHMKKSSDIRHANLLLAIRRIGSARKLADLAEVNAAYLSQVKSGSPESKTGKPKTMGDDVARKIEDALGEPEGWMDVEHEVQQDAANDAPAARVGDLVSAAELSELIELYASASDDERRAMLVSARLQHRRRKAALQKGIVNET